MEAVQENEKQELLKEYFVLTDSFNDFSRAIALLTGEKLSVACMLEELGRIARQQTGIAMELAKFGLKDYTEIWREYHKGEF